MPGQRNLALTTAICTVRGTDAASVAKPQLDKVGDVIRSQAAASFAVRIADPS